LTSNEFVAQSLALSHKTQLQVARESGFSHPNVISMIKLGSMKIPIDRVRPLAKSLEIDPIHLMRLVMNESVPETLKAIDDILGTPVLTENERVLIQSIRMLTQGHDPVWCLMPDDSISGRVDTLPSAKLRIQIDLDSVHPTRAVHRDADAVGC
jgi:hypothetical protein